MSYASCLNNRFAKQHIQTLSVNDLTVTGTYNSSKTFFNYTIESNIVENNTPIIFYNTVLPVGCYSIRGTLTVSCFNPSTLQSYSIFSTTARNALVACDYSPNGLTGVQSIPFSSFVQSDGVISIEFIFQAIGGDFNIISETDNLQIFQFI